jgi:uncharacterized membrane protein YqhA
MLARVVGSSRYLIIIAVVATFAGATLLLVYGGAQTVQTIAETIAAGTVSREGAKKLLLTIIELSDLFLLATALYVIAIGLYELFIAELKVLPAWLTINSLDDLKDKLIKVVIVVLGVLFLGQVVSWDGQRDLLGYGVAIALVIAALSYFLSANTKKDKPTYNDQSEHQ